MTRLVLSLICGSLVLWAGCQSGNVQTAPDARARAEDFVMLTGHEWAGTLTYRADDAGAVKTAPSTLRVRSAADGAWTIAIRSDDPGWAAEEYILRLKNGGTVVRRGTEDEPVVLRRVQDGTTEIITEFSGADKGKPATIRNKYIIGGRACSFRKLVLYAGASDYFKRYDYAWTR